MKVTKTLIGFLCAFFFLIWMPGFVMADETPHDSIQDIIGNEVVLFKEFEFTRPSASKLYSGVDYTNSGGLSFSDTDGLVLPDDFSSNYWRYTPASGWSSIADGRVVTFRARPTTPESSLHVYVLDPTSSDNRMYHISISTIGISTNGSYRFLDSNFVTGTEWTDYLLTKTTSGFQLYASPVSSVDNTYRLVLEGTGPSTNSSVNAGLYFSGHGAVRYAAIYTTGESGLESIREVTGGDVATLYDFQTKEGFSTVDGVTTTGTVSYGTDGMTLTEDAIWKFSPYQGWYPLSKTTAVEFRAKITETAKKIVVRLSSNLGMASLTFSQTGVTASAGLGTSSTGTAPTQFSFPGSEWIDCLVIMNDNGGYSVYIKSDNLDGKWYLTAETKDYNLDPQSDMGIQISGSGMIQYVKQYSATDVVDDSGTLPAERQVVYYQEEFVTMPTEQKNLTVSNGVVENGKLILNASGDISGSYTLNNGAIPLGGYAEFRMMTGAVGELVVSDGSAGISIAFMDATDTVSGMSSKTLSIGESGNNFRTWRILRNVDNSYSGYCKADGDVAWYLVFDHLPGKVMNSNPKIEFITTEKNGESLGVLMLDYLKICGPGDDEVLILTDGYGTKIVTEESGYDYYDCLRALVRQNENSAQVLLFAEYVNGTLVGWQKEIVRAGNGKQSVRYNAKNNTSKIKVFLWDGLDYMTPGSIAQTAKFNWEMTGNVKNLDGGFTLDGENGESALVFEGIGDDVFDVEWTMEIQGYTGKECVELYTGTQKMVLVFAPDGISCGDDTVSWEIGNDSHSYRVSCKSGVCYLYIDEEYVAELTEFSDSNESAKLIFRTGETVESWTES